MNRVSDDPAVEAASKIPSWTEIAERECLARLARAVPAMGRIVEVGCLYGGMSAVLKLCAPSAELVIVDDFSWQPEGYEKPGPEVLKRNLAKTVPAAYYHMLEGDSRVIGKTWTEPIDLLWLDGGHSYEYIHADLENFGPHAQVIACHDFDNPIWESVTRAIKDFLQAGHGFRLSEVVGQVAVMRRE